MIFGFLPWGGGRSGLSPQSKFISSFSPPRLQPTPPPNNDALRAWWIGGLEPVVGEGELLNKGSG